MSCYSRHEIFRIQRANWKWFYVMHAGFYVGVEMTTQSWDSAWSAFTPPDAWRWSLFRLFRRSLPIKHSYPPVPIRASSNVVWLDVLSFSDIFSLHLFTWEIGACEKCGGGKAWLFSRGRAGAAAWQGRLAACKSFVHRSSRLLMNVILVVQIHSEVMLIWRGITSDHLWNNLDLVCKALGLCW